MRIKKVSRVWCFFAVIALIVCILDGVLQYGFGIESTNLRRGLTGGLGGAGIAYLAVAFYRVVEKKTKKKL